MGALRTTRTATGRAVQLLLPPPSARIVQLVGEVSGFGQVLSARIVP